MTFYARMQALADRQIADKGSSLTIKGLPAAGDPVDGTGGTDGDERSVDGVLTGIDYKTFPETMTRAGDVMLILGEPVLVGEKWVNGSAEWEVVAVKDIKPDNATHIATKALVRG